MDDLRDLYQTTILDHNKSPRNFRRIDAGARQADGHNPVCGDKLTVYVAVGPDGRVADVAFEGEGCAISTASASLMTEYVKGKTPGEVESAFASFHDLVTGPAGGAPADAGSSLGKLAVFAGVREFPMRVKCATLCWHTLNAAIANKGETAKTE